MSRTVTIKIVQEQIQTAPSPSTDGGENKPNPSANGKSKDAPNPVMAVTSYVTQNVISTIKQQAEYYGSKYLSMTENYTTQTNIENAKSTIGGVVGIASSGVQGYATGAVMGGGGLGVAMAVISMITGIARTTLSALNNYENQIEQIHQQSYGNYFNSVRVGYVDGGRGTEN